MVLGRALGRNLGRPRLLVLSSLAVLAGIFIMILGSRPAAADSKPCTDPVLQKASVRSVLQVTIRGVDWPAMTSTTQITVPENWRGTSGLFGNAQQQGSSLACFLPVYQYDFQPAPPDITVDAKTRSNPAEVNITDTITMTDGPEAGQSWSEGLWSVTKNSWGYQVTFDSQQGAPSPAHGAWTVTLDAPDLNILNPDLRPTTDDGQGTLAWSFPASQDALPEISTSLTSPWRVRMNMASDLWPVRWIADTSWTLDDGVVLDIVVLLLCWRLLFRRCDDPSQWPLPLWLTFISLISLLGYAGYLADDYLWHNASGAAVWQLENIVLVAISALYFFTALGVRWYLIVSGCAFAVVGTMLIVPIDLPRAPTLYYGDYSVPPPGFGLGNLLVLLIPLLLAMTFAGAGTVLWISRLWPFGKHKQQGQVRDLSNTPFARNGRIVMLIAGMLIVGVVILGQSAAASYYYWQHSDLWGQGPGVFTWVASDLMSDAHWWIGDGIQWPLFYAILVGVFAVLWAMSADARGVFFDPYRKGGAGPADRGDLTLMAALAGCLVIGTWGFYDGVSLPLPFIVAFTVLVGWGLTRALSKLDWKTTADNPDLPAPPGGSLLVEYRDDLLTASERSSAARKAAKGTADAAPEAAADGTADVLQSVIPLEALVPAGNAAQGQPPPALTLPKPLDPGVTALALGPASTWWDNGITAVRMGVYLTIVPIAFDIYEAWISGNLSLINFPFGLQDTIGEAVGTALGWVIGLFMFGVFVPYLRGIRTPVKGIVFGLAGFAAFAADAGVRHVLGVAPYPTYIIDGLLGVALFATTGLLLDIRALRNHNDQGLISSIYRLGSVRVAVTYATTLIIVAVSLWQAVYLTGQTAQQRAQNISNTAQYVNSVGGSGSS